MPRAELIDADDVLGLLRNISDLLGKASYSTADAARRCNDLRPVIGALLDLALERELTARDVLWASLEIHKRAESHKIGGGL
jgi:hypothetical protein